MSEPAGPPSAELPLMVLVSGPPGAGKTTLAAQIASAVGLPLLSKDAIKVVLAESVGAERLEDSFKLGAGAVAVLLHCARTNLEGGSGLVIESAFLKGISNPEVAPLLAISRPRLIRCIVPTEVAIARYRARDRHWVHFDRLRSDEFEDRIAAGEFDFGLEVATLDVDTVDGYRPSLDVIAAFALRARGS